MAIKLADTARPNNYVDAEHPGTFPVAYAEDVWFADGTRLSEKTFDGDSIQKEELPIASADELGNIYQYIGVDGTYLNGHFYKCANDAGYYWKEIEFVNNPVVYSETEPVIQNYKNGAVVVYDGEDGLFYKKGHHYKKVRHSVYMYDWRTNGTDYLTSDSELSVGTVLYGVDPSYNISPLYIITDLDYQGSDIRAESIISSTDYFADDVTQLSDAGTTLITEFVDIGGGGSGGNDYEEFVGTQAEWDALSQSQKDKYDGKIVNITDDAEGENIDYYSTNEVKTNKVWMDGKPIYRKIIEKNLTFTGNSWNNTGIDVSEIDTLCNCVMISNKFACTGFYTKKASNQLQVYCVSDANWSAHGVILEYTKTTD